MNDVNHDLRIRAAAEADAVGCVAIYVPYVTDTVISFETEAPTEHEFARRIRDANRRHIWLVAELGGEIVGYAYAHEFHSRAAYRWACETSIYLSKGQRGRGIGRQLYQELLTWLADAGYRRAFAAIALPNPASLGIHRTLGFEECGHFHRVGWKNDAWHDVLWVQRDLKTAGGEIDPPAEPNQPQFHPLSIGQG